MGSKNARQATSRPASSVPGRITPDHPTKLGPAPGRTRPWPLLVGGLMVAVIAVVVGIALMSGQPSQAASATDPSGTVVQGKGGHWTNVTPDTLDSMMKAKDFTLLNVKTPYIGEIAGTDVYIPYTDLTARAAELPADHAAPIVVYCRSGNESAIAAQTLLDLGSTTIDNLAGGMNTWTASGRGLVQLNR